jgi:hypothetical protein
MHGTMNVNYLPTFRDNLSSPVFKGTTEGGADSLSRNVGKE